MKTLETLGDHELSAVSGGHGHHYGETKLSGSPILAGSPVTTVGGPQINIAIGNSGPVYQSNTESVVSAIGSFNG